MSKAPTSDGTWPLRPTKRADEALHARYPQIFQVGDPIAYTRNPEEWLPEWSLENKPLAVVPPTTPPRKRQKRDNMTDVTLLLVEADATPIEDLVTNEDWYAVAMRAMLKVAETGEKKPIGNLVKYSIEMRSLAKEIRETQVSFEDDDIKVIVEEAGE